MPEKKSYQFPAGKPLYGPATRASIIRALAIYLAAGSLGTFFWLYSERTSLRIFGAGLILPGSGFLALSRWYTAVFVLNLVGSLLVFPLTLILWFIVGAVIVPLGFFYGSAALAAWIGNSRTPSETLLQTPYIAWSVNIASIALSVRSLRNKAKEQEQLRKQRNEWIDAQIEDDAEMLRTKEVSVQPGQNELTRVQLKYVQFLVNLTRQPVNSWKGWYSFDQFRESGYRYQIYYLMYALGAVQCNVTPNFHGYISEAQRSAIEKCLEVVVQYYWAFESMWGRLSLNWDPIKTDNIMVTGWFLFGIMAYTATTRDFRYAEPGSLLFKVTPWHKYAHSIHTMANTLTANWKRSQFCLYSCEPNWVYTICNAYGAVGAIMHDRVFQKDSFEQIRSNFQKGWMDNFVCPSGNVVTFVSSLLGITIEGTVPSASAMTAIFCRAYLPDYARQSVALFRKEVISRDEKGKMISLEIDSASKVDPGNYTMPEQALFMKSWGVLLAKEFGDDEIAAKAESDMDECAELQSDGKGGIYPSVCSNLAAILFASAKVHGINFFNNLVTKGPEECTFQGPLLAHVPYPSVLVAKAWSNGKDLDLVLYDGVGAATVVIELERLRAEKKYRIEDRTYTADVHGKLSIEVTVDGRTPLFLQFLE